MQRGLVVAVLTSIVTLETPAVAQPLLSPDMPVDLPVPAAALGHQVRPAIAYGGGVFLAVWEDITSSSATDIRGLRFTPEKLVDGVPLVIASTGGQLKTPDVAFDGTTFRVVYADQAGGPAQIATVTV